MSKFAEDLAGRIVNAEQHQDKLSQRFPEQSKEELREFAVSIADSADTECIVFVGSGPHQSYREADKFYNEPNNIAMVNPRDPAQEATMFQPENGRDWFDKQIAESMRLEDKESIEVYRGIEELELGRARLLSNDEVERVSLSTAEDRSYQKAIDRSVDEQAAASLDTAYGISAPPVVESPNPAPAVSEPAMETVADPGIAHE